MAAGFVEACGLDGVLAEADNEAQPDLSATAEKILSHCATALACGESVGDLAAGVLWAILRLPLHGADFEAKLRELVKRDGSASVGFLVDIDSSKFVVVVDKGDAEMAEVSVH